MSDRERLARSFDAIVDRYDRGRFEYPAALVGAVVERLEIGPGRRVLDLAAGTGKLTRPLAATGAELVAVDPGEALLARLRETLPAVETRIGVAEAIPLPDASVDAVTVGSAFHWFRIAAALREIHRVLRESGGLALLWNPIRLDDPVVAAVTQLIDPLWGDARPTNEPRQWHRVLTRSGLFTAADEIELEASEAVDAERLVDRILSISAVAAAPAERQTEVEAAVRRVAAEHAGTFEVRTRPFALVARRA